MATMSRIDVFLIDLDKNGNGHDIIHIQYIFSSWCGLDFFHSGFHLFDSSMEINL